MNGAARPHARRGLALACSAPEERRRYRAVLPGVAAAAVAKAAAAHSLYGGETRLGCWTRAAFCRKAAGDHGRPASM